MVYYVHVRLIICNPTLFILEQDHSNLIRKAGEASGGSFQIHLKEAYTQFAWEIVEQSVMEKFDTKAARIFRLVKLKQVTYS